MLCSAARIRVEAGPTSGGGRSRFVTLAGTGALTPRRTGPQRVHLVAAAGGPLGGDEYTLDVEVGPGARLVLCSAAASIVLAARPGQPSRLTVRAAVAEGGELLLTPGAVVLSRRGNHVASTEIVVAAGGRLLAREMLVLGRTGEAGGRGRFTSRLDVGGVPVLRQTVQVGSDDDGSGDDDGLGNDGPAVLAGARALGQLLVAGCAEVPAGTRGPRAAWLPAAVPGCASFTASSPDPAGLGQLLDRELTALRTRAGNLVLTGT